MLALAALAGCSSPRTPPLEVFGDMKRQPKYKPQAASAFFEDGRTTRRPVPGTVARGHLKEDAAFYSGKDAAAYAANPLPLTRETLSRGRERFNIYCAPCHGQTGSGQGIVAQRGSWVAGNLTEQRIRDQAGGLLFETISYGRRTMPGYRFQVDERDRWAIVAYVRALQRAASGRVRDVPEELRNDLR